MANDAIKQVLEVEETIAKIRDDAEMKIRQIKMAKQDELDTINADLELELRTFKQSKQEELKADLSANMEDNKRSIGKIAGEYEQVYNEKQEKITDYIVKEVLKRYGS